jgi:hypothetical protein
VKRRRWSSRSTNHKGFMYTFKLITNVIGGGAPDSWKKDKFFSNRKPIAIANRYGQNIPINYNHQYEEELAIWDKERRWNRLRRFSFALASDITGRAVAAWEPINPDIITRRHPQLYDSPDMETREQIVLADLDLLNPQGREIHVYSERGSVVPRRKPIFDEGLDPCGILMNLSNIHELFVPMANNEDDVDLDYRDDMDEAFEQMPKKKLKYYIYPQAFLKKHGHIQANHVPVQFQPVIDEINRVIQDRDDDMDDDGYPGLKKALPLEGISFQGYNEAMHRIRPVAKFHDVQLGQLTAISAGSYAANESSKRKAASLTLQCSHNLPHERFATKIATPGLVRDLRLENVYTLDMMAMNEDMRNGA